MKKEMGQPGQRLPLEKSRELGWDEKSQPFVVAALH